MDFARSSNYEATLGTCFGGKPKQRKTPVKAWRFYAFGDIRLDEDTHYLLSRLQRFGKSLFLDTLKEMFKMASAGAAMGQLKERQNEDKYRALG